MREAETHDRRLFENHLYPLQNRGGSRRCDCRTAGRLPANRFHFPESLCDDFLASIDKVWDEPVDIMLGNHPFHNDTWKKRAAQIKGDEDAFVDPNEWHRYLSELKESCQYFLSLSTEEAAKQMIESRFMEYSGKYLNL